MSLSKEQIKEAALQLDPTEREALAEELLLSLSESDREEIDAAWLQEAKDRHASFLSGEESAKPVDEVP
jgi:hypothetical protein